MVHYPSAGYRGFHYLSRTIDLLCSWMVCFQTIGGRVVDMGRVRTRVVASGMRRATTLLASTDTGTGPYNLSHRLCSGRRSLDNLSRDIHA
jgi:hypothetical protein